MPASKHHEQNYTENARSALAEDVSRRAFGQREGEASYPDSAGCFVLNLATTLGLPATRVHHFSKTACVQGKVCTRR